MSTISVIMSTYKEDEYLLREAIESILKQTYKDFEFIIILDNPENEVHKKVINEYLEKDKRIHFHVNDKNLGLTESLNKGLSLAQSDFICRMDADDISLENRFEKQLHYLQTGNFDLIGGITQMVDENSNVIYSIKKVPTNYSKIKKALKYGQCIAHPTWFGKKKVFDNLEGYRSMPLCEDYDLTLRAVLKGYKISNLNETVLKYRMTANSISRNNLYEQYLFMRYITKEYAKQKIANIEDAYNYVDLNNNKSKSEGYLKANKLFNIMLKNLEDKQYFEFVRNSFKIVFTSKEFLNKIYRFFMLSIYS